jgi:Zn-dependent peptidase ImmA (M78 family)
VRVDVSPGVLAWAKERSGLDEAVLNRRFPKLGDWALGRARPTLRQLEEFARATHTPVGYLFLAEPPREEVPIPDFRTFGDAGVGRASADLLDTIHACQQRQEWYRAHAQLNGEGPVSYVGSLSPDTSVVEAASAMRAAYGFEVTQRGATFTEALTRLVEQAERTGVLVMVNGVVGSDTHRKLNPVEFRGFALVDSIAPLVFVNGADTKAAQIFTLAHELAHLWLGQSALDDFDLARQPSAGAEGWCNRVAAEFLVPRTVLLAGHDAALDLTAELDRLAREFKVSTLVILRRIHDVGRLGWGDFHSTYETELARVLRLLGERGSTGGNFYNTQPVRMSKRFTRAVLTSTLEGHTLYSDAFDMLGFRKVATFNELAEKMGVA